MIVGRNKQIFDLNRDTRLQIVINDMLSPTIVIWIREILTAECKRRQTHGLSNASSPVNQTLNGENKRACAV